MKSVEEVTLLRKSLNSSGPMSPVPDHYSSPKKRITPSKSPSSGGGRFVVFIPPRSPLVIPAEEALTSVSSFKRIKELNAKFEMMSDRLRSLEESGIKFDAPLPPPKVKTKKELEEEEVKQKVAEVKVKIKSHVATIQDGLFSLHKVFRDSRMYGGNTSEISAILIQKTARGYIVRKKYKPALEAIKSWQHELTSKLQDSLVEWMHRRRLLHEKVIHFAAMNFFPVVRSCFDAWCELSHLALAGRVHRRQKAYFMGVQGERKRVAHLFRLWKHLVSENKRLGAVAKKNYAIHQQLTKKV